MLLRRAEPIGRKEFKHGHFHGLHHGRYVDPNDGVLSLREAVNQANITPATDMIEFDASVKGKTLVLTGGELVLTSDVTIHGGGVTIDGNAPIPIPARLPATAS